MIKVHVECNPDEELVKRLGVHKSSVIHHNDKGRVLKELIRTGGVGVIDEDPESSQPNALSSFIDVIEENRNIKVLRDRNNNTLVIIRPRLEEWVVKAAGSKNLKSFGLPDNGKDLHKVINSRLAAFNKCLDKLLQEKNPSLNELKTHIIKTK